jgi:fibronectin type 3 domain-containing protein
MAIDRNQNHSALSSALRVRLPDLVRPQAPVILPYKSDENGVLLSWQRSSSEDVIHYDVYRKSIDRKEWIRLKIIMASNDSTYHFTDNNLESGTTNSYTVIAVDEAGLESDPAAPINAAKVDNTLGPPVQWIEPLVDKQKYTVTLKWDYDQPDVRSFKVFRSIDSRPFLLVKTLKGDKFSFDDLLLPGRDHSYRVIAEFQNGSKSTLSKELTIKY